MGAIHSDWTRSNCDHGFEFTDYVSGTWEVTNSEIEELLSEVEEFADVAPGRVVAGDLRCIDSAISYILEYDGSAEGERAQLLCAKFVGADGVEEGDSGRGG